MWNMCFWAKLFKTEMDLINFEKGKHMQEVLENRMLV